MKKKFLITFLLYFLCFGMPELLLASESYEFVSDVIQSLEQCRIAGERIKTGNSNEIMSLLKDLLVFKDEIKVASAMISKHLDSKNEFIKRPAKSLHSIYSMIINNNEKLILLIEETLNNPSEATSKEGTWLRKHSEIMAKNEELWRLLPTAITLATYSLVDLDKKEGDHICCLTITKKERDRLRSQLLNAFGEQVKQEAKAGILPIEFSGRLLWKFLAEEWKPSDSLVSK